mmetsp:Transcript_160621/g.283217  ORF Transcript_160621/g.283217 Transcript_160621/m.283217 type:complete len:364 (-) Transcript_160621:36-1127(-)
MPGADGMSAKFMKNAFVGWTFTAGLYYPPDYDPAKLVPLKHLKARGEKKEKMLNIRMMFPFTMICDSCGEYNYTGTKFTAKTETIKNEEYLGIKVYRFYGRCKHCWSEFTFKTDPKNSDYTMESGGKRTYEAWKDADMAEAEMKKEKEDAEKDQMKALEQKSIDVQAEMQRIEDLDAIRTLNKRNGARDQSIEDALEFLFKKQEDEQAAGEPLTRGDLKELDGFREAQEEQRRRRLDEEVERETGAGAAASSSSSSSAGADPLSMAPGTGGGKAAGKAAIASAVAERAAAASQTAKSTVGARFSIKRKATEDATSEGADGEAKRACSNEAAASSGSAAGSTNTSTATGGGLGAALGNYESDSS